MKHCKAKCGHMVVAVGAPGSAARKLCEEGLCDKCTHSELTEKEYKSFYPEVQNNPVVVERETKEWLG